MTILNRAWSYFLSKDMQSVHSYCVGFASWVPTVIVFNAQKLELSAWFLHCVTVHLMLEFALQAIVVFLL